MRLFLASYRFGGHRQRFLDMVGTPGRIAVIANASDSWPAAARASSVTSELGPLRSAGFDPTELDLRDFVGRAAELADALARFPAVWVRGGNTFVLRAQLARSGGDVVLRRMLADDALVYGGYSAGACILGPTLRGIESADPPEEVKPTTGTDPQWDGLGIVSRAVVPHWQSELLDGDDAGVRMVAALRASDVDFVTLTDEQVLIVDGDREEVL
ncbi:Type 1 glutamine amidotransferase-like domain-containing protein [Actinomycetes bacterium M1A6_2h]